MDTTLKVRLIGTSPLLMHNPAGSMQQPGAKTPKARIPAPEQEAELATYRSEDGYLIFPAIAVRSAMLNAAIGYTKGKRGLKSIIAGALIDVTSADGDAEWLELTDHQGVPLTDYVIDTRRAVIQRNAILRSRPKLMEWRTEVDIIFDDEFVTSELLFVTLNRAGTISGLGDFRPQKGGPFGRFGVEER